jgi:hypothetical protein
MKMRRTGKEDRKGAIRMKKGYTNTIGHLCFDRPSCPSCRTSCLLPSFPSFPPHYCTVIKPFKGKGTPKGKATPKNTKASKNTGMITVIFVLKCAYWLIILYWNITTDWIFVLEYPCELNLSHTCVCVCLLHIFYLLYTTSTYISHTSIYMCCLCVLCVVCLRIFTFIYIVYLRLLASGKKLQLLAKTSTSKKKDSAKKVNFRLFLLPCVPSFRLSFFSSVRPSVFSSDLSFFQYLAIFVLFFLLLCLGKKGSECP